MMRLPLIVAGILCAHVLWPYVQVDEQLIWPPLLPVAYFAGMWALSRQ